MSRLSTTAAVALCVAAPALALLAPATATERTTELAPVVLAESNGVDSTYIVYLNDEQTRVASTGLRNSTNSTADLADELGASVMHRLDSVGAFTARMTTEQVEELRKDSRVATIYQDTTFVNGEASAAAAGDEVELSADEVLATESWGIDRIDQRELPLDGRYNAPGTGRGVTAFIMDTGINPHNEYRGRLGSGTDIVDNDNDPADCSSHGTHVAGTVGGTNVGVATGVTLRAVRVMDCDGSGNSVNIVRAVDWMLKQKNGPAVANNSVGGDDKRQSEVEAIKRLGKGGIFMGIASGNDTEDTCRTYWGRGITESAMVGSTTRRDRLSSFSNYGTCNHIMAPGSDIVSTSHRSRSRYTSKSGTSMAAPHVTGAGALYLEKNPNASAREVLDALMSNASKNQIGNPKRTPNNLLNVSFIANMPGVGPTTPGDTPTTPVDTPTTPVTDPGQSEFFNSDRQDLRDYRTAKSSVDSTFAGGKEVKLMIDINHPCSQNLEIAVTTPDGVRNVVKRSSYSWRCSAWRGELSETYPMRSKTQGPWLLEVSDNTRGNEGTLNRWGVAFK